MTNEERELTRQEISRICHERKQLRAKISQLENIIRPLQEEMRKLSKLEEELGETSLELEKKLKEPIRCPYAGPHRKKAGKKSMDKALAALANLSPEQRQALIAALGG